MRVLYDLGEEHSPSAQAAPSVAVLGAFDGVHTGHVAALARARTEGTAVLAVLLWPGAPHAETPTDDATYISTLDERLEALGALGHESRPDACVVVPMPEARDDAPGLDARLAAVAARHSVSRVLLADTVPLDTADGWSIPTDLPASDDDDRDAEIRDGLARGDIAAVTAALGHPYSLRGEVVPGDRRGRQLGFPTANVRTVARKLLPANGIYAARVALPGEDEERHRAVLSIGVRPTFGGQTRTTEVYLLDGSGYLYGVELRVAFVARLREERKYDGLDALVAQIAADADRARELLGAS